MLTTDLIKYGRECLKYLKDNILSKMPLDFKSYHIFL